MDEGEEWLNDQMPGIYGEVGEIIREVFARMPYGQEFTLSNGRVGRIKKFIEPRQNDGQWEFAFDVAFDVGALVPGQRQQPVEIVADHRRLG